MPGIGGPMIRSTSEPGLGFKKYRRKPDDAWREGWQADVTRWAGPRWSLGKEAQRTPDRDHTLTPGPGAYKHDRDFMSKPCPCSRCSSRRDKGHEKDEDVLELDSTLTVQERSPHFSFSHGSFDNPKKGSLKETCVRFKDLKLQRNSALYPKETPWFNPGPGNYMQYTGFGVPSGGHRYQYLGGNKSNTWDSKRMTAPAAPG
mmetsp:Transcript_22322/g.49420  ORF Transcript_22322/g.49420 Transcript_22322/m.49420 type:complete len:202 (-) Transcript_22322:31-636(-)